MNTLQLDRLGGALTGRYAIGRELGRGGMATVYVADDLKHRYPEALEAALRSIEFEPEYARGRSTLGWAYLKNGRADEGLAQLEHAARLVPGNTLYLTQLGEAYGLTGRVEQARQVLRQLEELSRERYVSPYHMAYVYTGLGESNRAIDFLERAYAERAGSVYGIKGSFLFTSLHSHPRFIGLLRKMNLA